MSGSTFATRLADREHNLRLHFTVQGVEPVFVEKEVPNEIVTAATPTLDEAPDVHWTLNEASGALVNAANPGTFDGALTTAPAGRAVAAAVDVGVEMDQSAVNAISTSANAAPFDTAPGNSVAFWFTPAALPTTIPHFLAMHGQTATANGMWTLRIHETDVDPFAPVLYVTWRNGGTLTSTVEPVVGTPMHIAVTVDFSGGSGNWIVTLYVNGEQTDQVTGAGVGTSQDTSGMTPTLLCLAGFTSAHSASFMPRGVFDETLWAARAWTADEVAAIYAAGAAGHEVYYEGNLPERTQLPVIKQIEQGESTLDLDRRRMIGGSLRVILQDTEDSDLRALFAPMTRRTTYLTENIARGTAMTGSTTLGVQNTGALAAAGAVYIGGETFSYSSLPDSTSLGGVARAQYDSDAQPHFGGSNDGAGVYEVPPAWFGRRVKLYGSFLNDDGETTSDLTSLLGTFRLEAAPRYLGDHLWELSCSELSDEFAARRVYTGLQPTEVKADTRSTISGDQMRITVADSSKFTPSSNFETHALIDVVNGQADARVIDEVTSTQVRVGLSSKVRPRPTVGVLTTGGGLVPDGAQYIAANAYRSLRHIALLHGDAGSDILRILSSINGDETNGDWDHLPGATRSSFGGATEFRMGAGIAIADIDTASFLSIGSEAIAWSAILDKESTAGEWLSAWCLVTSSFWYVSAAGKITAARLAYTNTSSVATLATSNILAPPTVTYEEDSIAPVITMQTNYNPIDGEYKGEVRWDDAEMSARFPNADDRRDFESKAIALDEERFTVGQRIVRPVVTKDELILALRSLQLQGGRGRLIASMRCAFPLLAVGLGDVVTLSLSDVPDMEGGFLAGRTGRVVSKRPKFDRGEVELRVQLLDTLYHIAPAARIASISSATITLATDTATYPELASATPGKMFAVGWTVLVFDVSAATAYARTIEAVTDTTITLSSAPGWGALEANVDFITLDERSLSIAEDGESADGFETTDFLYQVDDSGFFGGSVSPTRFI